METPPFDFKPFPFGLAHVRWVYYPKPTHIQSYFFSYLCIMEVYIENRMSFGLNLGFELFQPDELYDDYELEINLLIIKIIIVWH